MLAMAIMPTEFLPRYGHLMKAHFALAHLVRTDPAYRDWYKMQGRQGRNTGLVTLDNGAWEGAGLSWMEVNVAANLIDCHEVWLPDVLFDGPATLAAVEEALTHIQPEYSRRLAACPQGKTWSEWLKCYVKLLMNDDVDTIGIPKHLADKHPGGRVGVLRELKQRNLIVKSKKYHCLGANDMTEVAAIAREFPWVRSIDSAAPVRLALEQKPFFEKPGRRQEGYFQTSLADLNGNASMLNMYLQRFTADCMLGDYVWQPTS